MSERGGINKSVFYFLIIGMIFSNCSFASTEFNGEIESKGAFRITKDDNDFMKLENQIRLKVEHQTSNIRMFGSIDVRNDAVNDNSVRVDLDEAFIDKYFNTFDLRIGKQRMSWGKTEGLRLTDVLNPQDWTEFLSIIDYRDLKIAITAFKINYYIRNFRLESILIPVFVSNKFATSGDWVFYNPFPSATITAPSKPKSNLKNSEWGVKVGQDFDRFDYSLSYFNGYDNSPTMHFNPANNTLTPKYHRIQNMGFDIEGRVFHNILRGEMLYVNTEDDDGINYAIDNPYVIYMIGLERTLRDNLTLNFQFIQKRMMKYDEYVNSIPMGFKKESKVQNTFTVNITDMWANQTIRPQIAAIYNEFDKDYFIRFELEYEIVDGISSTIGMNIYGGEDKTTLYGQFDENDLVYGKIRYSF